MTAATAGLARQGVARSTLRYRWTVAVLAVVLAVLMLLYVMLGPVLIAPDLVIKASPANPRNRCTASPCGRSGCRGP